MIKINLAPVHELEVRFWYLPDVITLVAVWALLYAGVFFYLDQMQKTIQTLDDQKAEFIKNTENLGPDIERYASLDRKINSLHQKIEALKKITISKITKYKPVILLEHLQNLRPDGLWFTRIQDDSQANILRLSGGAFDNIIISEFMGAASSTKFQAVDSGLLRTQVYFDAVYLAKISAVESELNLRNGDPSNHGPADVKLNDPVLEKAVDQGGEKTATLFPELKGMPNWQINLRYAERAVEAKATAIEPNLHAELPNAKG